VYATKVATPVRNFDVLAKTEARKIALRVAEAGYAAIDTKAAFEKNVRIENDELVVGLPAEASAQAGEIRRPLAERRIFFVGVGKCAVAAAEAAEKVFGEHLSGGIALDVHNTADERLKKIEVRVGTHPKPSEQNVAAAKRIVELLEGLGDDILVLALISGGGSSLLCFHDTAMTCIDEDMLFDALTDKGATIQELNTVRKHISYARGGGLAKAAYPAEVVSLIISDVPGNGIEYVASGPTVKDTSTIADAAGILARYGVPLPPGGLLETPKDEKYFEHVTNELFLTNRTALDAMAAEATRLGYAARIENEAFHGEARELAHDIAEKLHAAPPKTALLFAGESTVTLGEHPGKGGRNQELALAALEYIHDDELILPFASDGKDATEHAGALADELTKEHAAAEGASIPDALVSHASYDFFKKTGDALVTGLLESNVSDLLIALKN